MTGGVGFAGGAVSSIDRCRLEVARLTHAVSVIGVWVLDLRIDLIEGKNSIGASLYGSKDIMVGAEAWISWQ